MFISGLERIEESGISLELLARRTLGGALSNSLDYAITRLAKHNQGQDHEKIGTLLR